MHRARIFASIGAMCASLAASANAAPDEFFPLADGNVWSYEATYPDGSSREVRVSADDAAGAWVHLDSWLGAGRWMLSYQGKAYVWTGRVVRLYDFAAARGSRWSVRLSSSSASSTLTLATTGDKVATAAGTFEGCARIEWRTGTAATLTRVEWFAPGVGLVRWRISSSAGAVEGRLVRATVGGRTLGPSEREGMGATLHSAGTTFRVWAPFATAVHVAGDWNGWSDTADALYAESGGLWSADVAGALPGHGYEFVIANGNSRLWRSDPWARRMTNSAGTSVIHDPDAFDWGTASFQTPAANELVIYEMHVGTFMDEPGGSPGTFDSAIGGLDYLADLGVNAVLVMPVAEFPGDFSWGYNPSSPFAVESAYGGPDAMKRFVREARRRGIAVFLDVVYNHFGPGDLDLWQFDGWSANGLGGIYFYNDDRAKTPWGHTRPDFGRPEVRSYLRENALAWLSEFRVEGLRWDSTVNIRTRENGQGDLPDGWRFMQETNEAAAAAFPWKISIAEDLQGNAWITKSTAEGGAGFDSQWDAGFVHPIRGAVTGQSDADRDMGAVARAISNRAEAFGTNRVIYTESHDEVANGKSRVPEEIWPGNAGSWYSRKRSTLGAALVLTSPGIPMLFQGQEILEDGWFRAEDPVDWSKLRNHSGIHALYRDLIRLRKSAAGTTRGLVGSNVNVFHVNHADKVLAFHRWADGGPGDDVVVLANFADRAYPGYRIGFPRGGSWRVRLNSDWTGYGADYGDERSLDTFASASPRDGLGFSADVGLGAYSVVILSQDR